MLNSTKAHVSSADHACLSGNFWFQSKDNQWMDAAAATTQVG